MLHVYITSCLASWLLFLTLEKSPSSVRAVLYGWLLPSSLEVDWAKDVRRRVQVHSRVVSNVHSVLAMVGGWRTYFVDAERADVDGFLAAFGHSEARNYWLMVMCGYLTYDLLLCVYYRAFLGDVLTLVHHALIIVAFSLGVWHDIGTFYMAAFLNNELSTVFLNQNYFLALSPKAKSGLAYKANAVLLLATFFAVRVAFNLFNLHHMVFFTWANVAPKVWPSLSTYTKFMVTLLSALAFGHVTINLIWFRAMIRAVKRKLGRRKEA